MKMRRWLSGLAVLVLPAAGLALAPAAANAADAFVVYVSPTGSDTNDGLTTATSVKTLGRVQAILTATAPQADVEVRIKQGTYTTGTIAWHYYIPDHTITFMPIDYQAGDGIGDIAGRPVFSSNGTGGYWFDATLPAGSPGGDTNLAFDYLQVQGYAMGGLQLNGGTTNNSLGIRVPLGAGINNNRIFGMQFQDLGTKYNTASTGYGAIDIINSSNNVIKNNHFVHIESTGGNAGLIHGVYLAHGSSNNSVVNNQFAYITGGAMRTRNESNDNDISGNTFDHAGTVAFYSEWFCDASCVSQNPGHPRECSSHGNVFHDNSTLSGYSGQDLSWWALSPAGNTYPGGTGCSLGGEPRVQTYGNAP
jgi:hypothetical protein